MSSLEGREETMAEGERPRCWLMKSEPDVFGFEDLMGRPGRVEPWDGVRNYQARNFMRDEMRVGDRVLFYHSNVSPPHVAGLAEVASEARPDPSQWEESSPYHDARSTPERPLWFLVDIRGLEPLPRPVALAELKANPRLADMRLVQRGNRLSVMPVEDFEYDEIVRMAGEPSPS